MNCNVIRDLIPLCVDACCSQESLRMVNEHMASCPACKSIYESMSTPQDVVLTTVPPTAFRRIAAWKAAIVQSVSLFLAFLVIIVGVALEAASPAGASNGYWAISLVIPATGFLLSLANWYFVRLYGSKRRFTTCTMLTTVGFMLIAGLWAGVHYALPAFAGLWSAIRYFGVGVLLAAICCILSKFLSGRYAGMLGKE